MSNAYDPTQTERAETFAAPKRLVEQLTASESGFARTLRQALRPYEVSFAAGPDGVEARGDDVAVWLVGKIVAQLAEAKSGGKETSAEKVIAEVMDHELSRDLALRLEGVTRPLRPMSMSQIAFMNSALSGKCELLFGVGPTGTGKTHLAVAAGLCLLARAKVKHVVITKPHVFPRGATITAELRAETGYDDQFLAVEDSLHDLVGQDETNALVERGDVLLMPLGRMRGRTFNDTLLIIDEAHNMTASMMRMAVTRIGRNSRLIVTGDPAQCELRDDQPAGLCHLVDLVQGTDIAQLNRFVSDDIVRNDLVARLEALYEQAGNPEVRAAA